MPAHLYRDAHVGIRARLRELVGRIRERESEVTEEFWASLEPHLRDRLRFLRSALELAAAETLDDLAHAEGRLSAYVDELERLIARLPSMEEEWLEVPEEVADPPVHLEGGPTVSTVDGEDLVRTFCCAVRERDRNAQVVVDGLWSCRARFRYRDAPFSLRATAVPRRIGQVGDATMHLVTSVARAAPPLLVRHENLFASVGKTLGLWREVEVGDASFDGLFLIQATRETAERLLVPKVRAMLLALAHFDVPTLEIDPPSRTASLRWCFEPSAAALDAAVRVLAFIREAHLEVHFRR